MNDALCMDVLQGLDDLIDIACCLFLGVVAAWLRLEVFVEFSLGTVLQNEIDLVLVIEEAVQLHDVGVLQVALNLNLASQLVMNVVFK